MLRRLALGVLATPFLLRPGLAQTAQQQPGQPVVSPQPPPATDTQALLLGGMAYSQATAQLAERVGENPAVRQFGQLEVEEQTAFATARQFAGMRVPTVQLIPADKHQTLQQLQAMQGGAFDRLFIREQVSGHRELLQLQEQSARNPTSREEQMLATVAIPGIRSHMVMLEGIQRTLGG